MNYRSYHTFTYLQEKKTSYKRNKYKSLNYLSTTLALPEHKGGVSDGPGWGTPTVDMGVLICSTNIIIFNKIKLHHIS